MTRTDFCGECFDDFRYDDIGGYNPPCDCGLACRSCCNDTQARFCPKRKDDECHDFDDAVDFWGDLGVDDSADEASASKEVDYIALHFTDGSKVIVSGSDSTDTRIGADTVVEVNYYKAKS